MGALSEPGVAAFAPHSLKPLELLRRLRDPAPPVAGLVFDLAGVFYDDTVWHRWLLKLLGRMGLHTHFTLFFRAWRLEYRDQVARGELDYWAALRRFLREAGMTSGQIDEVEAAGHARRRESEAHIFPLPGVVAGLTRLNQLGIRMTLLSGDSPNASAARQRLDCLGLATHFEGVFAAWELARQYPSQSPVEVAIRGTGLARHEIAYVGSDTPSLADASRARLRTVALNYDDDALADVYLDDFEQLLHSVPWQTARAKAG